MRKKWKQIIVYKCDFCDFEHELDEYVQEHEEQEHLCKHKFKYIFDTEIQRVCSKCEYFEDIDPCEIPEDIQKQLIDYFEEHK